jgi:hypothetical protein
VLATQNHLAWRRPFNDIDAHVILPQVHDGNGSQAPESDVGE